nr:zinc finger, GRF-type [Tanacetum cinerariifolium]
MSYAPGTPRVTGQYVRSHCKCRHRLTVKTAWTKENLGKRFIACPDKSQKSGVYEFFDEDLPSDYYRELLLDLHSKVKKGMRIV